MDVSELFGGTITLLLAGIGGLAWLFKLHGDHRVLAAKMEAMESRINSFESRIYAALERIQVAVEGKVNRDDWERP